MTEQDKELIEEKFKRIILQLEQEHILQEENKKLITDNLDRIHSGIMEVYKEQRKTNGRVTKLEKQTSFICFLQRKPLYFVAMIVFIIFLTSYLSDMEIVHTILKLIAL